MRTDQPQLETLNVVNLRDHIKRQVCDAILNGLFKPGARLVEATIAEQLGVSRAPVREALVSLEREGIVASLPRRGYFVIDFTEKDIEELYSLRRLLEIEALRRALPNFTADDLAAMQAIVDQLGENTAPDREPSRTIQLDWSFHEMICRVADHSRLYSTWDSMRLQTWLLIGLTTPTHEHDPYRPKDRHQRILDVITAGDLARAEVELREHLIDAEERACRVWRELQTNEPLKKVRRA
ncbi:MAG: GntR family transcriptional regulator [Anaerolineae bacterium]|nr:GntR family transcriptional regulator [Anaerolineae bacterium]